MTAGRGLAFAILILLSGGAFAADSVKGVRLEGKIKNPQPIDLATLRRLPAEQVDVAFQTDRGVTHARYAGPLLWTVLTEAGGIADDAKGAELRHTIRVTGRDGYFVLLSTGEIAPEYGATPALLAYRRDGEPLGDAGPRLVLPHDKRGSRNVRDVVSILVE
jgi:hypothetical protein